MIRRTYARNSTAMATIKITKAYVNSFKALVIGFDGELPAIKFNEQTNTAEEVKVSEITVPFRAAIAQLIAIRPELSEVYAQITFAKDDARPAKLAAFVRLITTDASYEIDAKEYKAGEQFEDGTVARYNGYSYNITGATFAPVVEAKIKPKSLEDDLAAFGF